MKQLPIGIPIVTSLAAFILILLALLAGSRPGFMEGYDVVAVSAKHCNPDTHILTLSSSTPPGWARTSLISMGM